MIDKFTTESVEWSRGSAPDVWKWWEEISAEPTDPLERKLAKLIRFEQENDGGGWVVKGWIGKDMVHWEYVGDLHRVEICKYAFRKKMARIISAIQSCES